jgi:threonine aldolase
LTQNVQANTVLATLPRQVQVMDDLQKRFPFYIWTEETNEVRWMTAFDTTEEDLEPLIDELQNLCKGVTLR